MIERSNEVSPREWATWNHESEMFDKQAAHSLRMKQLEVDVLKLEAKWRAWFRLPKYIILLPVYILFGFAFIVTAFTNVELDESFWDFLR